MKNKKKSIVFQYLLCTAGILLFFVSQAFAHDLWLNADNHYPEIGETVDIEIGWGHKYTEDRTDLEVDENLIKEITAIGPEGEVPLKEVTPSLYRLKVDTPGAYIISARIDTDPGMFTITPEGRKRGGKKNVSNPIRCTAYDIFAKTIVIAGGNDHNVSAAAGHPLEIVLIDDPSENADNNRLNVRVLFDGKPVEGVSLGAKYAGYDEKGSSEAYFFETKTDRRGYAQIRINEKDYWKIMLSHTTSYYDEEVCDYFRYTTSFTFKIKEK